MADLLDSRRPDRARGPEPGAGAIDAGADDFLTWASQNPDIYDVEVRAGRMPPIDGPDLINPTVLRCENAVFALGDETGLIDRYCRDCTRKLAPDPYYDDAVYHRWRHINGTWLRLRDVLKRTPKG